MVSSSLLSIAPMIDWSTTHFRMWMRFLAPRAFLYTEMQTTGAIEHNPERSLVYNALEHPLVLQLGGSDKQALAQCAILAEQRGYDEINLNLGCPSDKVQAGRFGACLMKEPERVAACIRLLKQSVSIPVTAKTRIGIDHQDSYEFFSTFIHQLIYAGCNKIIVHARKAWLNGLNPKQNRTIPPINYEYVYRIKKEFNAIPFIINGNISTITAIEEHLNKVDGVMLGRLACDNPYQIAKIHHALYPTDPLLSRHQLLQQYYFYMLEQFNCGVSLSLLTKPIINLVFGLSGAKQWKQKLMVLVQSKRVRLFPELIEMLLEIENQPA